MKIYDEKLKKRWNIVMNAIGCEYLTICQRLSELEAHKKYYDVENGITVGWMLKEAEYWLSCYFENGNCRCDDRFIDEEEYKIWKSETGYLKRLITRLKKEPKDKIVADWSE